VYLHFSLTASSLPPLAWITKIANIAAIKIAEFLVIVHQLEECTNGKELLIAIEFDCLNSINDIK